MYRAHWSKFVKRKKRCCFHGNKQLKDAWRKKQNLTAALVMSTLDFIIIIIIIISLDFCHF